MTTLRTTSDRSAEARPTFWQRLPALSGIAFAVLLLVGFFISGSDAPDYTATDKEWTKWADINESTSRIGAVLTLIAGLVFLHFAGTIGSVLARAEAAVRGSGQLSRVSSAGALIAITGITIAVVTIAGAVGGDADPLVSRAVATATMGPFLVAAMGFAAWLAAAGLVTLRSGVFARWVGIVALLGGLAFFVTFFTLIADPNKDSVFGYGYFVGFLALAIWSIATSIALYRSVAPTREAAIEADLSRTNSRTVAGADYLDTRSGRLGLDASHTSTATGNTDLSHERGDGNQNPNSVMAARYRPAAGLGQPS